jgi:hypothetical protein
MRRSTAFRLPARATARVRPDKSRYGLGGPVCAGEKAPYHGSPGVPGLQNASAKPDPNSRGRRTNTPTSPPVR